MLDWPGGSAQTSTIDDFPTLNVEKDSKERGEPVHVHFMLKSVQESTFDLTSCRPLELEKFL